MKHQGWEGWERRRDALGNVYFTVSMNRIEAC